MNLAPSMYGPFWEDWANDGEITENMETSRENTTRYASNFVLGTP
jgi:hypothetical protein